MGILYYHGGMDNEFSKGYFSNVAPILMCYRDSGTERKDFVFFLLRLGSFCDVFYNNPFILSLFYVSWVVACMGKRLLFTPPQAMFFFLKSFPLIKPLSQNFSAYMKKIGGNEPGRVLGHAGTRFPPWFSSIACDWVLVQWNQERLLLLHGKLANLFCLGNSGSKLNHH